MDSDKARTDAKSSKQPQQQQQQKPSALHGAPAAGARGDKPVIGRRDGHDNPAVHPQAAQGSSEKRSRSPSPPKSRQH
jgi:hypothetical protein